MSDSAAASLRASRDQAVEFVPFYESHAHNLLVFFTRRTFDVEVARDLTAETFAQAFEHRRRFRGRTNAEAAGWLYGIARHLLARYIRRGVVRGKARERLGVETPQIDAEEIERVVELAGLGDLRREVAAAFARLPADQHEALQLRVLDERAYQDIAAILGISEPTARARVSRALRRLADSLDAPATPTTEATP
jgi:RNA polymerase sigma factor (sigma-70 family)